MSFEAYDGGVNTDKIKYDSKAGDTYFSKVGLPTTGFELCC